MLAVVLRAGVTRAGRDSAAALPSGAARAVAAALSCALALASCRPSKHPFTRERALEQAREKHPTASLPPDTLPPGVTAQEGIVYAERDGKGLALDLYSPPGEGAHPAVLVVHGGGWESGDRTMERPFAKRLAAPPR